MSAATDFFEKKTTRLHIYRVPDVLNHDYCFGGGNPIAFLNVDFFDVPWDIMREDIVTFIKEKRYFDADARFLVLSTTEYPTLTFTIEPARP